MGKRGEESEFEFELGMGYLPATFNGLSFFKEDFPI